MAIDKSKRNWIIAGVILLIIIIYFVVKSNSTNQVNSYTGQPNPTVGVNNIDISSLSAQDLATYNSLPDDASKADFLRILGLTTVVANPTPTNTGQTNTGGSSTLPSGTMSANAQPHKSTLSSIWQTIKDDFNKIFHRNSAYVQVAPINSLGCDALGYNKSGVKC